MLRTVLVSGTSSSSADIVWVGDTWLLQSARGDTLTNLTNILAALESQRTEVQRQLSQLDNAIQALSGTGTASGARSSGGRRTMSAAGRRRIAEAQRARWAKFKASSNGGGNSGGARKRTLSPAARRRIAAAQRARWAKWKAGNKS